MMSIAMTTLDGIPKPSQMTSSGAMTKTGNACSTSTIGQTRRPSRGRAAMPSAVNAPRMEPNANPARISASVTSVFSNR